MANYSIESNPRYRELAGQFLALNGRQPNDLDKMQLAEQIKLDEIIRLGSQLDRVEAMVKDILSKVASR